MNVRESDDREREREKGREREKENGDEQKNTRVWALHVEREGEREKIIKGNDFAFGIITIEKQHDSDLFLAHETRTREEEEPGMRERERDIGGREGER